MKLEAYLSPLNDLQLSGSYLKIERAKKIARKKEKHKKGRAKKQGKKRKPQNREKKEKIIGGKKRECVGALKK